MSGWRRILSAAEAPTQVFRRSLRDPEASQRATLARILGHNANSEFGRAHGFAGLADPDSFRAATPIAAYEDFAPLVARAAAGESGVLTTAPVVAFEETGGSQSGRKLVPYTQASLDSFRAALLPWLADLAHRRPGLTRGRAYVAISPAARRPTATTNGLPVGLGSDAVYLGADLGAAFATLLAVPPEVAASPTMEEWRMATLRHLVACADLSFVSVWSPTFFLELLEAIPPRADALAQSLSASDRARLKAATLGGRLDATALWPMLDVISCWTDGPSAVFADRLKAAAPHAALDAKGLLATEAPVTLGWGSCAGAAPALDSVFIEFIDAEGDSRLAHELRLGAGYRVVVTTPGGLYRYDLGDQVRCVDFEGPTPRLVFEGRTALVSDLVGEKLTEAFVADALARLGVAATLVANAEAKPFYEIWLDASQPPECLDQIERALCANPQYGYARALGQLGPLRQVVRPGIREALVAARVEAGARLGDVKHHALAPVSKSDIFASFRRQV